MSSRNKDDDNKSEISISSSDDSGYSKSENIKAMVLEEPMYYILGQYLETEDGKNIATILQELVHEIRSVKELLLTKKESS